LSFVIEKGSSDATLQLQLSNDGSRRTARGGDFPFGLLLFTPPHPTSLKSKLSFDDAGLSLFPWPKVTPPNPSSPSISNCTMVAADDATEALIVDAQDDRLLS
jgi:hypothetical protein